MKALYEYTDTELAVALEVVADLASHHDCQAARDALRDYVSETTDRLRREDTSLGENHLAMYRDLYERVGKISSIKHYRNLMKVGLKDAKEAIEALAVKHGWTLKHTPSVVPYPTQ